MRSDEDSKIRIFALLLLIALFLILLSAPLVEHLPSVKVNALSHASSPTATPLARAYLPDSGSGQAARSARGRLTGLVEVGLASLCAAGLVAGLVVLFRIRKT